MNCVLRTRELQTVGLRELPPFVGVVASVPLDLVMSAFTRSYSLLRISRKDFTQLYPKRKTQQDASETRRGEYADRSVHKRT